MVGSLWDCYLEVDLNLYQYGRLCIEIYKMKTDIQGLIHESNLNYNLLGIPLHNMSYIFINLCIFEKLF